MSVAAVVLKRTLQNGPIHLLSNYSLDENQYAWSTVADYVWLDQPVYVGSLLHDFYSHVYFSGTGYSTADADGYGELTTTFRLLLYESDASFSAERGPAGC